MVADNADFFEQLFRDNYKKLYFFVLNIVDDEAQAEDITEDVFAQVWEQFGTVTAGDRPLVPLLYTLARNRSLDYLRHQGVESRYADAVLHDIYDEEDLAEHHERIERVMQSVQRLPEQTRRVFKACFLEGRKYRDVADEFGISVNTVKTYVTRALAFIRGEAGTGEGHGGAKKVVLLVTYLLTFYV